MARESFRDHRRLLDPLRLNDGQTVRLGYILTDITNTPRTNYGRKRKQLIKQFGLPQDSDVVPAHHLYAIIQSYTKGNSNMQTKQSAKKVIEYLGLKAMLLQRAFVEMAADLYECKCEMLKAQSKAKRLERQLREAEHDADHAYGLLDKSKKEADDLRAENAKTRGHLSYLLREFLVSHKYYLLEDKPQEVRELILQLARNAKSFTKSQPGAGKPKA